MGRWLIALFVFIILVHSARSRLYESGEPDEFVPKDRKVAAHWFDNFRLQLSDLRGIAVNSPHPSPLRQKYIARRDALNGARRRLSAGELNALGACNYRLYDMDAAMSAWLEASRKERGNFAAYSN